MSAVVRTPFAKTLLWHQMRNRHYQYAETLERIERSAISLERMAANDRAVTGEQAQP